MSQEIMDMLRKMDKKLDEHGRKLDEHGKILDSHGKKLDEHSLILKEHTDILRALEHSATGHKAELDKLNFTVLGIEEEIKAIRGDLSAVELITSKNWNDITRLKAIK